jgi:hypothetical protein
MLMRHNQEMFTSLLHLTMIGTKKHGVGFENKMGPFSIHDPSKFSLVVLIEIKHVCFPTFLVVGW